MFDVIHAAIFVRWNDGCDEEELSHRPEAVAEKLSSSRGVTTLPTIESPQVRILEVLPWSVGLQADLLKSQQMLRWPC